MDYMKVPKKALDIAIRASKAANAEYWACDIALGIDNQYRILECATAFAAFPYIRDWIGQYLMWKFSDGRFPLPHIPLYNWEELGKINSSLLRTMRHITFAQQAETHRCEDGAERFNTIDPLKMPLIDTSLRFDEEWPSEIWDRQSVLSSKSCWQESEALQIDKHESCESHQPKNHEHVLDEAEIIDFLSDVKGLGMPTAEHIVNSLGTAGVLSALNGQPELLLSVKNIKQKKVDAIIAHWQNYQTLTLA